jgi:hypothetical protein
MVMERSRASAKVLMGLSTVMCLTRELFHVNRIINVVIRTTSTKDRISLRMSLGS